ncbi:MAG TPA: hypothetical protein VN873_00285 [Candidatus Angelobacter sp.]|nr:hypothetical protein [Candidatus Angelobacter sp.]
MRVFFAVVALSAVGFLAGCDRKQDSIWKWKYSEIKRVVSPDAKVDAVIADGDAGAVTRTTTFIFLVPHGAKVDEENDDNCPVFRSGRRQKPEPCVEQA